MSDSDLFGELERVLDAFSEGVGTETAVDVVEREDTVEVRVNLPGFAPEDVDVQVVEGRLEVEASRETSVEGEFITQERSERRHRSVTLPAGIDADGAEASYDQGVLTVEFPRTDGGDGTDIPVN